MQGNDDEPNRKWILLSALVAQVIVVSLGVHALSSEEPRPSDVPPFLLALTMLLSIAAVVLIFRDLYKRRFPNPNSKLTWLLVMVFTGGIGMVVYVLRHALHARASAVNA